MILSALKQVLAEHGQVSLEDLTLQLEADAEAVRGMLELLIRKGQVRRLSPMICGEDCKVAHEHSLELYEWIEGADEE